MAYIGNKVDTAFTSLIKQDLTGASGDSLTLTHAVSNANDIALYINNVRQEPTSAYSTNGTAVSLTGSVGTSDDIYVLYLARAVQTTVPPDGSVTNAKVADNAGIAGSKLGTDAILQVKQGTLTVPWTSGSNLQGWENTPLSVSITPQSTSSKILITGLINHSSANGVHYDFKVVRNGADFLLSTYSGIQTRIKSHIHAQTINLHHIRASNLNLFDSPSSTNAVTYTLQAGTHYSNAGVVYLNRPATDGNNNYNGSTVSTLTAMEIGG